MPKVKNYPPNAPASLKLKRIAVHYAGSVIRSIISPIYSQFVEKVPYQDGISANILTKNDIWIRESIESIKDFVDEFIIIDSSDEDYYQRNAKLFKELRLKNIQHIRKEIDIYSARVLSHSMSKYRWILHWDGDMVALDSGKNDISNLFKRLKTISGKKTYYEIYFPLAITGSTIEKMSTQGYQVEPWIYSNCDKFKWELKKLGKSGNASIERAKFPLFYRKIYLNTVYGMHLKYLFPIEKLITKKVQYLWMNPDIREKYSSFRDFIEYYKKRISVDDLISDFCDLDETNMGKMPKLLEPYVGLDHESIVNKKLNRDGLPNYEMGSGIKLNP